MSRVGELRAAVARLRRELAGHPAEFPDRVIAEEELAALAALAAAPAGHGPDVPRLRRSLLLIVGALGSMSALAPALGELRRAADAFGTRP
ncbi:DUF5955 family protein [Streptomyces sp. NPDC002851]